MVENREEVQVTNRVYRLLRQYWQIGVAVSVATALFLIRIDHIRDEIMAGPIQGVQLVLLLIITILWFVAYMHATLNELEMLRDYRIATTILTSNWVPLTIILLIALCFGALVAFATNLLIYSCFAMLLIIFNSIGFTMVQRAISTASQNAECGKAPPIALVEYYLYRPFMLHQMGMLIGFFAAFLLSLLAHYEHEMQLKMPAAFAVIVTILLGECVILRWRRLRDRKLQ